MCGRYTSTAKAELIKERFHIDEIAGELRLPRFNIAPSQPAPVVIHDSGKRFLTQFKWGLVPVWSKDPAIGNKMINARAETLNEKKSFTRLLKKNRCLVVADGYYEWIGEDRRRVPMRILLKSREPFAFAGLWDQWNAPDGSEIRSFTIITTSSAAHELMEPIHHRMPVMLAPDCEEDWLVSEIEPNELVKRVLQQYPAEKMDSYEVSKVVNSPKNDLEKCIEAIR